jgi:hypothetical protein
LGLSVLCVKISGPSVAAEPLWEISGLKTGP